jgi:hypothetical protein
MTISKSGALLSAFYGQYGAPPFRQRHGIVGAPPHVRKAGCADFQIGEETVMVIMALFAAFLIGIVVGSGLEILVRSRIPSA